MRDCALNNYHSTIKTRQLQLDNCHSTVTTRVPSWFVPVSTQIPSLGVTLGNPVAQDTFKGAILLLLPGSDRPPAFFPFHLLLHRENQESVLNYSSFSARTGTWLRQSQPPPPGIPRHNIGIRELRTRALPTGHAFRNRPQPPGKKSAPRTGAESQVETDTETPKGGRSGASPGPFQSKAAYPCPESGRQILSRATGAPSQQVEALTTTASIGPTPEIQTDAATTARTQSAAVW